MGTMTNTLLDKLEKDIDFMKLHSLAKSRTEKGIYLLYTCGETIIDFDELTILSRIYRGVLNYNNLQTNPGEVSPEELENKYKFDISKISEKKKVFLAYSLSIISFELKEEYSHKFL